MSEQNKIDEIKAYVELCEEEGLKFQHLDNLKFLLQEIARLQKEEEFWKQAAENRRENNYEFLKKQAILKDALEEIELILTDDTSTQAIEINQVINRAREAL